MIERVEQEAAWQGFVDKWLAVQPYQRIALAFVDGHRYPGHVALAALEQEWLGAAYGIHEPQVAAAKLGWWAEEMAGARESGGRHPLTQILFDDERAQTIPTEQWLAPVVAAVAQLEQGTATDFQAQLDAAAPLHAAFAALETAWWFGTGVPFERAARVATLNHLLYALVRLEQDAERDRLPLPMEKLARYGLSRSQLRSNTNAREQAIKAQLDDLRLGWRDAMSMSGPLSVFRAVESHQAKRTVQRSGGAEALTTLQAAQSRATLATAWHAWRAARAWRRWVP